MNKKKGKMFWVWYHILNDNKNNKILLDKKEKAWYTNLWEKIKDCLSL